MQIAVSTTKKAERPDSRSASEDYPFRSNRGSDRKSSPTSEKPLRSP